MNLSTRPHKEGHHEILDEHGNVVGSLWKWPFNEGVALTLHGVCWTRDGMGWTEGELSRQYCFRRLLASRQIERSPKLVM